MKKWGHLSSYHVYSNALKCFAQAVTNCLLSSSENTKRAIFYILISITLEVNMMLALLEFLTLLHHP